MALTIKRERFTLHTPCVEVPVRVITYNLIFRDFALTFFPAKPPFVSSFLIGRMHFSVWLSTNQKPAYILSQPREASYVYKTAAEPGSSTFPRNSYYFILFIFW